MRKDIAHFKTWLENEVLGEFSFSEIETKHGFVKGSLSRFASNSKSRRNYLGISEDSIFIWAKKRGYDEYAIYETKSLIS